MEDSVYSDKFKYLDIELMRNMQNKRKTVKHSWKI